MVKTNTHKHCFSFYGQNKTKKGDLQLVSILTRTVIVYVLLLISLKLMGKREIGQLEVSELVSTLLVSEIAAIPITEPDIPLLNALIPVLFIVSLEIVLSYTKNKSNKLKKLLEGEPTYLIYKGKLKQNALLENRISINELLCEIRMQSVGDISDVQYAILEQSGDISILKKGKEANLAHALIVDGNVNKKALKGLGYDEEWVSRTLKKLHTNPESVFLLTVDDNNETRIIMKENKK